MNIRRTTLPLRAIFLGVLCGVLVVSSASAHPPSNDPKNREAALAASQAAIGRTVPDISFRNTEGSVVHLADYRGKPLVVSFIYTACADVCPVTTHTLAHAVEVARNTFGENSFSVVTVGFDAAADTPARMRAFARKHGIRDKSWKFLSGGPAAIDGLSDSLGFVFYRSPKGFDHLTQTSIIDSNGKVYRQVYGENFETPNFVEPLKEILYETASPFTSLDDLIKKVRLFCTLYDPAQDKYRFDYSMFIKIAIGMGIVLVLASIVLRGWWRILRQRRNFPNIEA